MRPFLTDLLGPGARSRGFYRPGQLDATIDAHLAGRQNHEKLLWQMLALEQFLRSFKLA